MAKGVLLPARSFGRLLALYREEFARAAGLDCSRVPGDTSVVRGMRGCLAVVVVAGMALVPVSGSQGAGETQIDSLRVSPLEAFGTSHVGTVLLKAGVRYHIVVTGYITKDGPIDGPPDGSEQIDAFYTFVYSKNPGSTPFRDSNGGLGFFANFGAATRSDFLPLEKWSTARPSYDPGHRYEDHFTLTKDARLEVSEGGLGDSNFTYGGPGFTVSVFSGGGSTTPPPPRPRSTPSTCVNPAFSSAHAAVIPSPWQVLGGRGYGEYSCYDDWLKAQLAVVDSPPLGKLEKVKATIRGVTDADLVAVARYVSGARAYPRGQLRANCLAAARVDIRALVASRAGTAAVQTGVQRSILDTLSCLAVAEEIDAYITSHPEAQRAQTPACALTPFQVTIQTRRRRPTQVRVTTGSAPNAPLQVTCVLSQGQIELTVKSRKAGVPLSRSLGSRLAIGIVRSRRDQPGGQVAVRFDRP